MRVIRVVLFFCTYPNRPANDTNRDAIAFFGGSGKVLGVFFIS